MKSPGKSVSLLVPSVFHCPTVPYNQEQSWYKKSLMDLLLNQSSPNFKGKDGPYWETILHDPLSVVVVVVVFPYLVSASVLD